MGENDGNTVRFRLIFDDVHLLRKSQRSKGLCRTWFVLKPDITSIGDLVSQISNQFGLRDGIVLYMDNFVLPSFISTAIIMDKDVIRVRRNKADQNDMFMPCDGQNLLQDAENARVQDLDFNENFVVDGKSEENSQENRSCDKEILTKCMESLVHQDSLGDVGSTKQNRSCSKKLVDAKGQHDESNSHEAKSKPNNSSDVRKKKKASSKMVPHSSDGKRDFVASKVQPGSIQFQPREHGTREADETQEPVVFDEGSSIKELDRNKENTFQQINKKDQCFSGDGAPISDEILSLPKSDGILPLSKDEGIFPLSKSEGMSSAATNLTKPLKHVINFETFTPIRRLPVKGDILAYRYIELSPLIGQQLSSPQIGEVSSFDNKTLQIILLPVLDYVFLLDEHLHETIGQPNASRYKENGSLEIEYLSLVDVRLVKGHTPKEEVKACQGDQDRKDNWEEALLKGNLNELNVFTEEQSNDGAPWIPNKNAAVMSWSCSQPIPPYAGRGNGRGNRAPNRGWHSGIPNRNDRWNNGGWNLNRSNPGAFAAPDDNPAALPWPFGFPNPWEYHDDDNDMVSPDAKFPGQWRS